MIIWKHYIQDHKGERIITHTMLQQQFQHNVYMILKK